MTIPQDMLIPLRKLLILHEGLRKFGYLDTKNNITAGIGHNISANPIADDILARWFQEDTDYLYQRYTTEFSWFKDLNAARQIALIDLGFMGFQKVLGFKKMLRAFASKDYESAAREIINSQYARDVGQRAYDLAAIIRTGEIKQ